MATIYTWGYRGRTRADLEAIIKQYDIRRVADVRRRARGGRIARGWRLEDLNDIPDYSHYPTLGNHARPGEPWLTAEWNDALPALGALAHLVRGGQDILLLCAEVEAATCHRSEIAEYLLGHVQELGGDCEIVHL